jgi:hypothetical protein
MLTNLERVIAQLNHESNIKDNEIERYKVNT